VQAIPFIHFELKKTNTGKLYHIPFYQIITQVLAFFEKFFITNVVQKPEVNGLIG
jgi:hypothetical protein